MRIARRLFVVPLAPNHHGKTTMLAALLSQGGAPPGNRLVKGQPSLVSPWGRTIDAYVFGRSYQESEKLRHGRVLAALVSSDPGWCERELVIIPSHLVVEDVAQIIAAAHRAGFDAGAVADVVEIWMTLSPAFSGYRVMRQRQAFADPS